MPAPNPGPGLALPPTVQPTVEPTVQPDVITVRRLDFLPIALAFLRKLEVAALIDAAVPPPAPGPQSTLARALGLPPPRPPPSVGVCAEAMILNILEGRVALVQMEDWLRGLDVGTLWGPEIDPAQFTDDRLARALDAIFHAGTVTLFSLIVMTMMRVFCVVLDRLHFDTSTMLTYGAHAVPDDAPGPRAVHGHSKDHRPDLLQWVFGMTVQHEGLPVLSTLHDGNAADSLVHRAHLELLATQVRDPRTTTFVSDSKGCNAASLGVLRSIGFHVTTLLPHTFAQHDVAVAAALAQPAAWVELARRPGRTRDDPERVWRGYVVPVPLAMAWPSAESEGDGAACMAMFDAVVVHSTELEQTHARTAAARLAARRRKVHGDAATLAKCPHATSADAERAAQQFLAAHATEGLTLCATITAAQVRLKRTRRGRPRADEPVVFETVHHVTITVADDVAAQAAQARSHGLFVLVTSHRIGPTHPATTTFEEYHEQEVVEAGFRWIKAPGQVSPLLLQTPARIEALSFLFSITLLLYRLLQRQMRGALAASDQTVPGPNRVPTRRPTTQALMRLFVGINVVHLHTPDGPHRWLAGWTPLHAKILEWLGLPPDLYESRGKTTAPV